MWGVVTSHTLTFFFLTGDIIVRFSEMTHVKYNWGESMLFFKK